MDSSASRWLVSRIFVRSAVKVRPSLDGVLSSSYTSVRLQQLHTPKTTIYIYIYIPAFSNSVAVRRKKNNVPCVMTFTILRADNSTVWKMGKFFLPYLTFSWRWLASAMQRFVLGFVLLLYSLYNKISQSITPLIFIAILSYKMALTKRFATEEISTQYFIYLWAR